MEEEGIVDPRELNQGNRFRVCLTYVLFRTLLPSPVGIVRRAGGDSISE